MCGRYAATLPPEMMVELFRLLNSIGFPPRYNITPTQPIAAIWEQEGRRTVQLVRWGLIPGWVKDPRTFPLVFNARSEGMIEKPAFRGAIRNARCIIPASGYFEWMKDENGKRRPYYITLANGEPMAFAGLYSSWMGPNGEEQDTAAIVTVEPNLEISSIYDRMPAILRGDEIDAWLNTGEVGAMEAASLAKPPEAGAMAYHPVGKAIGRADAEGSHLIEPIDPNIDVEEDPRRRKKVANGQLSLF